MQIPTCKSPPLLFSLHLPTSSSHGVSHLFNMIAGDCLQPPDDPDCSLPKRRRLGLRGGSNETESLHFSNDQPSFSSSLSLFPRFGSASVCGRRKDMEDTVSLQPFLTPELHYFGVYDGHGCSHVAQRCRNRLHNLVKEELGGEWKEIMGRSFSRMDGEVESCCKLTENDNNLKLYKCRCNMESPECDAVGSTAVVAVVTKGHVIVANCGDSRAVLCRDGKPIALSDDHKPDREDERRRVEEAGGRVIYWEGARVLGVLAMSRAIGDKYLKPYVCCEPEVTVTERGGGDECLILASDGLWDVVSNEMACSVALGSLRGGGKGNGGGVSVVGGGGEVDRACSETALLLTRLALARRSNDNVSVVVVDLRKED